VRRSRPLAASGPRPIAPGPALLRARRFAEEWYEAWNAHDLDRILSHYREDVTFRSPFVAAITGREDGALVGRDELASYFRRALEAYPDLHFEPLELFLGAGSVVVHYRSVRGSRAAEAMWLDRDLRVTIAIAHYDRLLWPIQTTDERKR
jgi:ketosteroid isomerase-like protein